jgi:hypothetical protein
MASALAVLVISCSAASAQAASGLEPGVHIDPGSPAAKEYALPLNQARQTGASSPAGSSSSSSSAAAAPFGAGIHPPGGSGGGPSHRGPAGSDVSPANASRTNASEARAIIPAVVLRSASGRASPGGDGSILALLGGGVAILVLGGFGGMVLRRSHRVTR